MTANHVFTVLTRKPTARGGEIKTERTITSKGTLKDGVLDIKDYDKEKETIKVRKESKKMLGKQGGRISSELVSGATFRWEHKHNTHYYVVKEVVTLKELICVMEKTDLSGDVDIAAFKTNIIAAAEPASVVKTIETELTTAQMQDIYNTSYIFENEERFNAPALSAEAKAALIATATANLPKGVTLS